MSSRRATLSDGGRLGKRCIAGAVHVSRRARNAKSPGFAARRSVAARNRAAHGAGLPVLRAQRPGIGIPQPGHRRCADPSRRTQGRRTVEADIAAVARDGAQPPRRGAAIPPRAAAQDSTGIRNAREAVAAIGNVRAGLARLATGGQAIAARNPLSVELAASSATAGVACRAADGHGTAVLAGIALRIAPRWASAMAYRISSGVGAPHLAIAGKTTPGVAAAVAVG